MMRSETRDRGQGGILLLIVTAALFASLCAALVVMGGHLIDRTRAQSAADAAALGSVVGGRDAAEALADRHGATLVSFRRGPGPGRVTVVVRVRTATATAAATDDP